MSQKNGKIILIVDDDDVFRNALSMTLTHEGFETTQASNGKVARDVLGVKEVHAVISDINMPVTGGIELLHYARKMKPELPFILMTGFAELKETQEAHEIGARGFLPKPFKREELMSILRECLDPPKAEPAREENQDLLYCKLSIDEFVSGHEIKYDIFVRLSEKKYVKVAHQGEDIPVDRINSYKEKNIRYLHMRREDFKRYMGFNLTLLPLVSAKKAISPEKKRNFLKHTSDVLMEHLHLAGVDEEGFQAARVVVESTTSLLAEPDEMMSVLEMLNTHSDHLYAHGLGVSTYSVMIAKKIGWKAPATLSKVAMGGLLHDIGKKEIPREVLMKPRRDMSAEEVQLYETHALRGMEILGQVATVPSDILQIVMQHHENCLGLGFPMRLTKQHIHPMARLVSVANEVCNRVLKGPSCMNLSPMEALQRMFSMQREKFDPQFLEALMNIFNVPVPDLKSEERKIA
ncbi:MAG: response regulator [Bdellovibrionales bacterium]|nr:response regulator [Bdellovibrionales bacterium]